MNIAHATAQRSTCDRKHVGCVLVVDRQIIATGYNGSVPGGAHCDDVGHDMLGQHCASCGVLKERSHDDECVGSNRGHSWTGGNCVRTIHAELNAITQAARRGVVTMGATAFVNTYPCWGCFKALIGGGIAEIVYDDAYRVDERVAEAARGRVTIRSFKVA